MESKMEIPRTVITRSEVQSVVNFLMKYVQDQDNMDLIRKCVQYLVKQLKQKNNELNSLITVICTGGSVCNKCITLPRPVEKIWTVGGHFISYPHVLYARIWRWPDLLKDELQHVKSCQFGFGLGNEQVCINPYHYERKPSMRNQPSCFNRRPAVKPIYVQNFVNNFYLARNSIIDALNKENNGLSAEDNWGLVWTPSEMQPLGDYHESCHLDERYSTFLVDGIRCALRFMEEDDINVGEQLGKPSWFDDDDSSTSGESYHSAHEYLESPVPSTSSGQVRSRFTDDSTGSEQTGGVKKKIWRYDSGPAGSNQEGMKTESISESRDCPTHHENEEFCMFDEMNSHILGPVATVAVDCAITPILENEEEMDLYYRLQWRRNN